MAWGRAASISLCALSLGVLAGCNQAGAEFSTLYCIDEPATMQEVFAEVSEFAEKHDLWLDTHDIMHDPLSPFGSLKDGQGKVFVFTALDEGYLMLNFYPPGGALTAASIDQAIQEAIGPIEAHSWPSNGVNADVCVEQAGEG